MQPSLCWQIFAVVLLAGRVTRTSSWARAANSTTPLQPEPGLKEPQQGAPLTGSVPCKEFTDPLSSLPWTLGDCIKVWEAWQPIVPYDLNPPYVDRALLRATAEELRRRGSPCMVQTTTPTDGVGSSSTRNLGGWMYAQEMGCDWIAPGWGSLQHVQADGTAVYCHDKVHLVGKARKRSEGDWSTDESRAKRSCTLVNWLQYFSFDSISVDRPRSGVTKTVWVAAHMPQQLEVAMNELNATGGLDNRAWDHLLIRLPGMGHNYLLCPGSWDQFKREAVRNALGLMRENFHRWPRPWYDRPPRCDFDPARLNIALHLRMGDRLDRQPVTSTYFDFLQDFMTTVANVVLRRGLPHPLFHVFSETVEMCPSAYTGLFDEFPTWPVQMDQVASCMNTEIPADCPQKRAGAEFCNAHRSGVFRVRDNENLTLHVGADVKESISCIAQADGILMGCSTFGQFSGLLSNGIKFFSMACRGERTASQYMLMPPLAIAEMGNLWVPVVGSWRDPVLMSEEVFDRALDRLIEAKQDP